LLNEKKPPTECYVGHIFLFHTSKPTTKPPFLSIKINNNQSKKKLSHLIPRTLLSAAGHNSCSGEHRQPYTLCPQTQKGLQKPNLCNPI
jgi:hypothetical protein